MIIATHLFSDVERIADRMVAMARGRMVLDDDVARLRASTCVVQVAATDEVRYRLRAQPACVALRRGRDAYEAVVRCAPSDAAHMLTDARVDAIGDAQPPSLEELFVRLAGGRS